MTKREQLTELEAKLAALYAEIRPLRQEVLAEKYGVNVGDEVEYRGSVYKICYFDEYWPRGKKRKKDGTFSNVQSNLYNFPEAKNK